MLTLIMELSNKTDLIIPIAQARPLGVLQKLYEKNEINVLN